MKLQLLGLPLAAGLFLPAQAQVHLSVGPQVGGGLTTVRFHHERQFQTRSRPGLAAGVAVSVRYRHWALQPALLYAQQGYQLSFTIPGDVVTSTLYYRDQTRLSYLTLPLSLVYHQRADGQGWQVLAGPYVGWLLGGHYAAETAFDPTNAGSSAGLSFYPTSGPVAAERGYDPYDRTTAHLKGVDVGLQAGLGYQHRGYGLQATYTWGLRDLYYYNFAANVNFSPTSIPYYTRAATYVEQFLAEHAVQLHSLLHSGGYPVAHLLAGSRPVSSLAMQTSCFCHFPPP